MTVLGKKSLCREDVYWISKNLSWTSFVLHTTNKLGSYLTYMGV